MLSGNLSFLNLLTMVLAVPMLDGRLLARWLPIHAPALQEAGRWHYYAVLGYAAVVVLLSIRPAINLISPRQMMNASFEPLHLVNTYGAFGSVGRTRYEMIVEGSSDPAMLDGSWRAYEFKGKPGDPLRMPPQIAPYQLRLDWQMWFAAMSRYQDEPWFVNFVAKLLQGDRAVLSLLRVNPFPNAPPRLRPRATVSLPLQHGRGTPENRRVVAAGIDRPDGSRRFRWIRRVSARFWWIRAGWRRRRDPAPRTQSCDRQSLRRRRTDTAY
jgi:hypothetical protein